VRTPQDGEAWQERRKPSEHPLWSEGANELRTLPRQSLISDEGTREAKLAVGQQDQPGPAIGLFWMADAGQGPIECLLEEAEGVFNGLITNDKFCMSRHISLRLTWSRFPLRLRFPARASGTYLPGESAHVGAHRGGSHETAMAHTSPGAPPAGWATTVGPGLPTPAGLDDAE